MKERFRQLMKNKDTKALMENLLSLSALRIINFIFPIITLPYLARVIGVDKFGAIAYCNAFIVFFATFVDYGFNYTAVRDIARAKSDLKERNRVFCNVMVSKVLLMVVSLIILIVCIALIPQFKEYKLLLIFTWLYIPGYTLFPEWFFQGMEKMKFITVFNVLAKLIFTLCVFIFIKNEEDYILQPIFNSLGFFVSGVGAIIYIRKIFKVKLYIPNLQTIYTTIKHSSNMFISLMLPNLYTNFSVILLGNVAGRTPVGIFDGANRIVNISQHVTGVVSRATYPFLARRIDKHSLYERFALILSLFFSIALFFMADWLVALLLSEEFTKSADIIRLMSISPIFLFMMNTYGTNYLVLVGQEHILRNIVIVCSILGFILTIIITPLYSYTGTAITFVSVWGIRGITTMMYAKKHKRQAKI